METEKKNKTSAAQIAATKRYRDKIMAITGETFYDMNKKYIKKYEEKKKMEKLLYNGQSRNSSNNFIGSDNTRKEPNTERTIKKSIYDYFKEKQAE